MRIRFREAIADRAARVSDGDVDTFLNHAFRYGLPGRVSGQYRDGEIRFALTSGKDVYDFDLSADVGSNNAGLVRTPKRAISLVDDQCPLEFYSEAEEFWQDYKRVDSQTARPSAVLFEGRTITLRPTPTAGLTLAVPASLYPVALTDAGVANETRAFAVVHLAATKFAGEQGYEEIALTQLALLEDALSELRGAANTPKGNRRRERLEF